MTKKYILFIATIAIAFYANSQPCTNKSQCLNRWEQFHANGWGAASYATPTLDTVKTQWKTTKLVPGYRYRCSIPIMSTTVDRIIQVTASSNDNVEMGYTTGYSFPTMWLDYNNYQPDSGVYTYLGEKLTAWMYYTYNNYVYICGDSGKVLTDTVYLRYRQLWEATSPNATTGYNADSSWIGLVYNGLTGPGADIGSNYMGAYGTEATNFSRNFGTGQPGGYSVYMCPDSTCADNDSFQVYYTKNVNLPQSYVRIRPSYTAASMSLKLSGTSLFSNLSDYTMFYTPSMGNQWQALFTKTTGSFSAGMNVCKMDGDLNYNWGNKFNAYVYSGTTPSDLNYQGTFTTDSLSFYYKWLTDSIPPMVGERCGKTMTGTNYSLQFRGFSTHIKGKGKFRVRVTGTSASANLDWIPFGGSTWQGPLNTTSDATTSLLAFSKDTFNIKLVFSKTTGAASISFNYTKLPKDPGTLHSTKDTVCLGNSATLSVDTVDGTETQWYKNACGGSGIYIGSGATITVTPDSSTTYYVRNRNYNRLAQDTANVLDLTSTNCASKRVIAVPKPSAPTAPTAQSACSDTVYTFTFDSVLAGSGGNQIEWATNSSFSSSTIVSSPATIHHAVDAGDKDTIWIRSRVSTTGCLSSSVITTATANLHPSAPTTPVPQAAGGLTPYTFTFSNVIAGTGANQVEWSTNSGFTGSTTASSPTTINPTVSFGNTDTIWIRSRNSSTGCVGAAVTTTAKVDSVLIQVTPIATDTMACEMDSTNIIIYNPQYRVRYELKKNGITISNAYGSSGSAILTTHAIDTTAIFVIVANDTATLSQLLIDTITVSSEPDVGLPVLASGARIVTTDSTTCYTFTATNSSSIVYTINYGGAFIDSSSGCINHVTCDFIVRATAIGIAGCKTSFTNVQMVVPISINEKLYPGMFH